MKYRILTNRKQFKIQTKGWFFWHTQGQSIPPHGIMEDYFLPDLYETEDSAKEEAVKRYGTVAERQSYRNSRYDWRPI